MNHIELGRYGEELGAEYLEQQGYTIIERNVRYRFGEVDIIAKKESVLVVIEVKTRRSKTYGLPCESVHWRKKQHIRQVIAMYLATHDVEYSRIQFDVLEIFYDEHKKAYITHRTGCAL